MAEQWQSALSRKKGVADHGRWGWLQWGKKQARGAKKLQELANEEPLTITVAHDPPATSTWNQIEHRLFAFISINWRAKPLTSLEVVLELISHTTTKEG